MLCSSNIKGPLPVLSSPFPPVSQRYKILLHILSNCYFESLNASVIPPAVTPVVLFQAGTSTERLTVFTWLSPSLLLIGLCPIASRIHSGFQQFPIP